jgi:hypothetical protein
VEVKGWGVERLGGSGRLGRLERLKIENRKLS